MNRVLCVGGMTADILVSPVEEKLSVGTLARVDAVRMSVGGNAVNCSVDLAKLGVPVALCTRVGRDDFGRFVLGEAARSGVDVRYVAVDDAAPTTVSVVLVHPSGERSFLYSPGSTSQFSEADVPDEALAGCEIAFITSALILTRLDGEPCARLLRRAKDRGIRTAMDTSWDFEGVWLKKLAPSLPLLDWFLPSREEAEMLSGESDPDRIADRLMSLGPKNVVVKLGAQGALVVAGGERFRVPADTRRPAVDTTGAGDAFCAGFLAGLAQGWGARDCARLGCAVAAHCVRSLGATTGIPDLARVLADMDGV